MFHGECHPVTIRPSESASPMRVLDSHLHLWDPAVLDFDWLEGRLLQRFGPAELAGAVAEGPSADARAFVFVQAEPAIDQSLAEVDWVSDLATEVGVVGIVARASIEHGAAVEAELAQLRARPLVVGVRRLLQGEALGFAASTSFIEGARAVAAAGLSFDACVLAPQLPDVIALADAVPDLAIVLDHLGKPPIGTAASPSAPAATPWLEAVTKLAERPNVVCKLSGLPAESSDGWTPAQVTPYLDAVLEAFGSDRLLFGGDWPVSWPYASWLGFVAGWLADRAPDAADAVLWRNAERVYGLS